jgi:hypothetical protein
VLWSGNRSDIDTLRRQRPDGLLRPGETSQCATDRAGERIFKTGVSVGQTTAPACDALQLGQPTFRKGVGTMGYSHDDPSLKTGEGGLTVWTLTEMAHANRFDELNNMFNNGLTMDALPVGMSAGAGLPAPDVGSKFVSQLPVYLTIESKYLKVDSKQLVVDATDFLVGKLWRGKIFFSSNNKRAETESRRICSFRAHHSCLWPNLIRCCWIAIR